MVERFVGEEAATQEFQVTVGSAEVSAAIAVSQTERTPTSDPMIRQVNVRVVLLKPEVAEDHGNVCEVNVKNVRVSRWLQDMIGLTGSVWWIIVANP